MLEAYLYRKLKDKKVQCQTCAHYCLIENGQRGICGTRENIKGKLYTLNYGKAIAVHIDPIEKKPFFHFLPGTPSFSVAATGCNFFCKNCQNWDISQATKDKKLKREQIEMMGFDLSPQKIVEEALKNHCPSISYTYTEPTIFLEYALETMKFAKKNGLKNVWVTNGYLSKESLEAVVNYLDAANVDLKGFTEKFYQENCGAKLQPVLDTLVRMKKRGIWLEITTLIIPTLNDDEKTFRGIAKFIKEEIGWETPWHVTQFSGAISWKLQDIEDTPIATLEKACQIGLDSGLKYVYSGNVPGLVSEDTFCPKCKTLNINRTGYYIERFDKNGKCYKCNESLNLIL